MALMTSYIIIDLLIALGSVAYFIYWYLTNNDDYWDKRGVPNDKKTVLFDMLRGNLSQTDITIERYKTFSGQRFGGLVQLKSPTLFVRDPSLIEKILIKDFNHFPNRVQPTTKKDPFGESLFGLKGQRWRDLRHKLTPTFTSGKLKGMFDQVNNCGDNMLLKLEELLKENTEVEAKSFLFEFTLDVISSCAFGIQFKPGSPELNEFKSVISKLFNFSILSFLKMLIIMLFPKLADLLQMSGFSSTGDYFINLTKSTKKYRQDNKISRNDYYQLLLSLQEQEETGKESGLSHCDGDDGGSKDPIIDQLQYVGQFSQAPDANAKLITDDTICGNTVVFLLAGSESTASTVSLVLYELSRDQDVQTRLQREVDYVLARHGGWSYAAIKDMTYLDQVIQEAQRLHPILPFLSRECEIPYRVPDTDLILERGTQILIPIVGLHRDPQYYPEPDQFRPERFEGNNFKPSPVYLPFGDGPRICIATRFAVMEIKICLAKILSQYTLELSPKTKQPLTFDRRSLVPSVKDGIWMAFSRRTAESTT